MIHSLHRLFHQNQICQHLSHRWHLPCFRSAVYDYYCRKHNTTCFHSHR